MMRANIRARNRFARTAFAHDGDDLARDQVETDAINRVHDALRGEKCTGRAHREVSRQGLERRVAPTLSLRQS